MANFLIPLSFIAEYEYCPRSTFYLLVDAARSRDENAFIQSGRQAHEKVDSGYKTSKSSKKIETSLRIFSEEFHISGKLDILELHKNNELIPVELKRGKTRYNSMHEVQLALIALCLKEMFPEKVVEKAEIFFTQDRQKKEIILTQELLEKAKIIANEVFIKTSQKLDPRDFIMVKDERCNGCCFYDLCYLN